MGLHKDFDPLLIMLIDPTLGDLYVLKSGGWVIRSGSEGDSWKDPNGIWWYWDEEEGTWINEEGDPLPNP